MWDAVHLATVSKIIAHVNIGECSDLSSAVCILPVP